MKSIILFMPYYGKLPEYFDIWLSAIEHNESIDFCLITDLLDSEKKLSKNVKLLNMSFSEFQKRIQSKFDFNISIGSFGRISQFRPALGYVFPEVISKYDYWGFIECDLIPGNIRNFITDELLERYDKFFKLGHFQIYKNNERMNTLFMKEYKSALSYRFAFSKNILFFEELLGMHNIAEADGVRSFVDNIFSDIQVLEYGFKRSQYAYPNISNNDGICLFEYENGALYEYSYSQGQVNKREVIYAHFQKRNLKLETSDFSHYIIVPNRFLEWTNIRKELFDKFNQEISLFSNEYRQKKKEEYQKLRKVRYGQLCWWQLKLIRRKIVNKGGVDLDGK